MNKDEMRESPRGRSMLSLYKTCPRKWAFKYLKGFKAKDLSDPLILGSAIHETQAEFYRGAPLTYCLEYLDIFLSDAPWLRSKASAMFNEWFTIIGSKDAVETIPLAIEQESEVFLPNGFRMTVRWDRVLLNKKTKEVFISDTKTTSGSASRTLQLYNYSDQPKLYIASIMQNKPEWLGSFRGWRTDVIYGRELKSGAINTEVLRSEIVNFSEEEINDTLQSYATLTDDIAYHIERSKENGIAPEFYSNSDSCFSYNRLCPYYSFCHEIDSLSEPPGNYDLDPWLAEGKVLDSFKEIL